MDQKKMTVVDVINQEQKKRPNKKIGNVIALQIICDDEEIYFCDCNEVDSEFTLEDLDDVVVKNYYYEKDYGELEGKLKLVIEVL